MDADALARLILHRCGDALDEATTTDVKARLEGQVVPINVLEAVTDVIGAFEQRLVQLEQRLDASLSRLRRRELRFGSAPNAANAASDVDEPVFGRRDN
jgi:hypothetical protein